MKQIFKKSIKSFFVILGVLFVLIGIVGIFLPLLPTTPFLLVAAFCFARGSDKFHAWLLNHKVLGPPIADWNRHRVIRLRYKVMATVVMAITTIIFHLKVSIPLVGKTSYFIFVFCLMAFIWSRKGH